MTAPASSRSRAPSSNFVAGSKRKPTMSRTLRRGGMGFHVARVDDTKWLWAGYVNGVFPEAPKGLEAHTTFRDWLAERTASVHEIWVLTAPNDGKTRAVGV